jgi:hypothetical protein
MKICMDTTKLNWIEVAALTGSEILCSIGTANLDFDG